MSAVPSRIAGLSVCWERNRLRRLEGARFGKLTVIAPADVLPNERGSRWLCRCDCGKEKVIRRNALVGGTKSCGCLIREAAQKRGQRVRKARGGDIVPGAPYGDLVFTELQRWPAPPREAA